MRANSATMVKSYFVLVYMTALVAGTAATEAYAASDLKQPISNELALDGNWQFATLDRAYSLGEVPSEPPLLPLPLSMKVPSNWYLSGVDHAGAAVYRREFVVPHDREDQRVFLNFSGVDYEATVWINGVFVGQHAGYFSEFSFDVTERIRFGEKAVVLVLVNSPKEDTASWSQWKHLIKGVLSHHDTRPGGAWSAQGQDANTGGIWGSVKLLFSGPLRISSLEITPQILRSGLTCARIKMVLDAKLRESPKFQIKTLLAPANFSGPSIERTYNVDRPDDGVIELTLPAHAGALWWPKQLGSPNLYSLTVEVWQGSSMSDRRSARFGYRTVAFNEETGRWSINGQSLFLKGTNYIPTQWLSEMTKAAYVRDILLMQDANINAVRVHAVIISQSFYAAADEAGLLVWQDFPLQWGYSDEPKFHSEAFRQAGEMIENFFNHPSIFTWCMQNEPPWDAWWMVYKYPGYQPQQNKALTAGLADTARRQDPTRHVHAYSATKEHTWQGWYSGNWRDFEKPTKEVLIAEYGAQALPNLPTLQRIFGVGAVLWPDTDGKMDIWRYHNFQPDEAFKNAGISKGNNIAEFIANTQSYQSNLIRVAAESYRRQKYAPVGGIFQFMFVEDWPSVNWAVVDYWRNPKPGYGALKQAYQPVLPSFAGLEPELNSSLPRSYSVWVVNDLREGLTDCDLTITLRSGTKVISESHVTFSIDADAAQHIVDWSPPKMSPGPMTLMASVTRAGKVVGSNRIEISAHD
jgi:beta-mannosidase